MKSDSARKRHGNAAFLATRRTPCRFKCSIEVCERRAGAIKEAAAGIRQLDAARHAAEQLQIDLLLDRLDEAAERRLRNTKPLRRTGDVPFFGDGDEAAQVPEFHCHNMNVMKIGPNISWLNASTQANSLVGSIWSRMS